MCFPILPKSSKMTLLSKGAFVWRQKKRLSKALASAGIPSRRAAEEIIFEGRVKVNGQVVEVPQTLVCWETDEI